jgi:hypothetical protein
MVPEKNRPVKSAFFAGPEPKIGELFNKFNGIGVGMELASSRPRPNLGKNCRGIGQTERELKP